MEQKLIELLCEALEIEDRTLNLSDNFRDYPEWDSLGQLSVIAALDEQFGIVIEGAEFNKISSVGDLLEKIKSLS
jgi:acyl carrier protein